MRNITLFIVLALSSVSKCLAANTCDVIHHPEKYDGKKISIRGRVEGGILDAGCGDRIGWTFRELHGKIDVQGDHSVLERVLSSGTCPPAWVCGQYTHPKYKYVDVQIQGTIRSWKDLRHGCFLHTLCDEHHNFGFEISNVVMAKPGPVNE